MWSCGCSLSPPHGDVVGLQGVIVVYPGHPHLLFKYNDMQNKCIFIRSSDIPL